jgi:hypothetical protein
MHQYYLLENELKDRELKWRTQTSRGLQAKWLILRRFELGVENSVVTHLEHLSDQNESKTNDKLESRGKEGRKGKERIEPF